MSAETNEKGSATSYADIQDEVEIPEETPGREQPEKKVVSAPAWIVTFADLATLLLTFFVLMLSFSNMEIIKMKDTLGSMNEAFGSQKELRGEHLLVHEEGSLRDKLGIVKKVKVERPRTEEEILTEALADAAFKGGIKNSVQIFTGPDGISLRVSDSVMFAPGEADLNKGIDPFLKGLAQLLRSYKFSALVEGHTDNVPISTKRFPSNWELSTVRATTVLRRLLDFGAPQDKLGAVGYADRKPVRDHKTPMNRAENRRVEFKFIKADS